VLCADVPLHPGAVADGGHHRSEVEHPSGDAAVDLGSEGSRLGREGGGAVSLVGRPSRKGEVSLSLFCLSLSLLLCRPLPSRPTFARSPSRHGAMLHLPLTPAHKHTSHRPTCATNTPSSPPLTPRQILTCATSSCSLAAVACPLVPSASAAGMRCSCNTSAKRRSDSMATTVLAGVRGVWVSGGG
jgi:hypothetical protein